MRDITELPWDVFLLVLSYLSPRTCVRCRAVSRQWHGVFISERVSHRLLQWNFPRCRELRLAADAAAWSPSSRTAILPNHKAELVDVAELPRDWAATFAEVTRRYYHLSQGRPRVVEKLDLAESSRENGSIFSFYGVAPWNRFLRLNDKTSKFHYPDPAWWYSQEDGLLVYPAACDGSHDAPSDCCDGNVYCLVDFSSGHRLSVPFDVRSKHIRRVRLAQGVLVFEWAEALPYHQLNDREVVHRHFVTAFDVVRKSSSTTTTGSTWAIEFRSEWKLHFLGLPLNRSDRFFSAHTANLYAVYFWQSNRSLYQDDPIEQLAVWDISSPSSYRPSEDPTGHRRPTVTQSPNLPTGLWNGQGSASAGQIRNPAGSAADVGPRTRASLASATAGPQVIRRMAWRELDFYGLRQRATPQLRALALDELNLYFIEEEHRWADGQHSSLNPPRVHLVRSTAIPIVPASASPAQPAYLAATRSASDAAGDTADLHPIALATIMDGPVHGPIWVDTCGADGDANMNFCRRVVGLPAETYANRPSSPEPAENAAGLEPSGDGSLRQATSAPMTGWPWVFGDDNLKSPFLPIQSTRWPGWAPCWRHEDFPYLTVAEMVDVAAGVRVAARHCFMLETLSVHVRPAVSVKDAPPTASELDERHDAGQKLSTRRPVSNERPLPSRSKEVFFPDEMWSELVAKGHIAGDERWIVGEDSRGRITLVRF